MKKFLSVILVLSMVLSLGGCCLRHEWEDPTCDAPKTCAKCGKTEGEPKGHSYKDATCSAPKTCKRCGKTKGDPLAHTYGSDWTVLSVDCLEATQEMTHSCTVCGEAPETKTEDLTTFIDGDYFLFNGSEFTERLETIYNETYGEDVPLTFEFSINKYGYINFDVYNKNNSWLCWGTFYDINGTALKGDKQDAREISSMRLIVPYQAATQDAFFYLFKTLCDSMSMAVDPTIQNSAYKEAITNNTYAYDEDVLHDLHYTCTLDKDESAFKMDIDMA